MQRKIAAIGADVGGTWIRLQALDASGRPVRSLKQSSPALKDLPSYLKRILRRWKIRPAHLAVGSKGVWSRVERRTLKKRLKDLGDDVTVMSDVEAAWHAAFKKEGILVISGTGSIAYAEDSDGCSGRAGGLGPERGDEGSGYWIGKEWLRRQPSPRPSPEKGEGEDVPSPFSGEGGRRPDEGSVREIAALTKIVFRRALRGDRVAGTIIMEAQEHLADLVKNLSGRLHWKRRIPVSWSGTVLDNIWFRKGFLNAVGRDKKRRFQFIHRTTDPATAVARYALNHART